MTILSRESVVGNPIAMLTHERLRDLIETARAYHDLRDAVLALCDTYENTDLDCPYLSHVSLATVEAVVKQVSGEPRG